MSREQISHHTLQKNHQSLVNQLNYPVRGTTSKRIIEMAKEAGANKVTRLDEKILSLKKVSKKALVAYLVAGDPDLDSYLITIQKTIFLFD